MLLVSDVRLHCEGLAESLTRHPHILVAASAETHERALELRRAVPVDVVVLDMGMPNALELVRALVDVRPETKIVAFAVAELACDIVACAEAGILGYVLRSGSVADLVATVERVARGEAVCPPRLAVSLFRHLAAASAERRLESVATLLTHRELEVVALLDQGLSNKAIAHRLCVESATVKNHVHNICEKLRVHRRGEAVAQLRRTAPELLRAPSRGD